MVRRVPGKHLPVKRLQVRALSLPLNKETYMLLFFSGFGVGCLVTLIVGFFFVNWLFSPFFEIGRGFVKMFEDRLK